MASYVVERSAVVRAPVERVHALVADFRQWPAWSPWEDVDPDLHRAYDGPETGPGSSYAWSGNRKAGSGRMAVTSDTPERVDFDLHFEKPIKSDSAFAFVLRPTDAGTEVTWRMAGEQRGLMAVLGKVVSMDRLVGKDFEKGLARLRAVAEQAAP